MKLPKINIPIRQTMHNMENFVMHKLTDHPGPSKDEMIYARKMHRQQEQDILKKLK